MSEPLLWFSTFSITCGAIPSSGMRLAAVRRRSCGRQGSASARPSRASVDAISLSSRAFAFENPETGLPEPFRARKTNLWDQPAQLPDADIAFVRGSIGSFALSRHLCPSSQGQALVSDPLRERDRRCWRAVQFILFSDFVQSNSESCPCINFDDYSHMLEGTRDTV
jgi:hypothetical protein